MNYVRTNPAAKGSFKCFECRASVRSKDGTWAERSDQQVFLCNPCNHVPAPLLISPANAAPRPRL